MSSLLQPWLCPALLSSLFLNFKSLSQIPNSLLIKFLSPHSQFYVLVSLLVRKKRVLFTCSTIYILFISLFLFFWLMGVFCFFVFVFLANGCFLFLCLVACRGKEEGKEEEKSSLCKGCGGSKWGWRRV